MELGSLRDEVVALREKAGVDREAWEAEMDTSGDALFNYRYGCCAFAYNICGSKPKVSDGMPDPSTLTADFFVSPRCPLIAAAAAPSTEPIAVEDRPKIGVDAGETALPVDPPNE